MLAPCYGRQSFWSAATCRRFEGGAEAPQSTPRGYAMLKPCYARSDFLARSEVRAEGAFEISGHLSRPEPLLVPGEGPFGIKEGGPRYQRRHRSD